jgi:hypothetical protein
MATCDVPLLKCDILWSSCIVQIDKVIIVVDRKGGFFFLIGTADGDDLDKITTLI